MSTIVSRGIDSRGALAGAHAHQQDRVRARRPHPLAGQSRALPGRASDPSTRMLEAESTGKPPSSAFLASSETFGLLDLGG